MTAPLKFPRSRRLRFGHEFSRTKTHGQRVVNGCLIANWLERAPGAESRLGVITSRKVGNAVARARARRLLREAFRLHQHDLDRPVDLVLVARQSIVGKSFQQVERDFLRALRQGRLLKNE